MSECLSRSTANTCIRSPQEKSPLVRREAARNLYLNRGAYDNYHSKNLPHGEAFGDGSIEPADEEFVFFAGCRVYCALCIMARECVHM